MDDREFEQIDPDNVDEFLRKKMMEAADRYEEELNSDPSLADLKPSPRVFENIMNMIGKEQEEEGGKAPETEKEADSPAVAESDQTEDAAAADHPDPSSAEELLSEEDRRALELGRKQLAHPVRRRVLRYLGVAAAVLVGMFGASMTSEANREKLINVINVLVGREGVMRLANDEDRQRYTDEEEKAWAEIQEKLGISPIVFMYRPDRMEFESYRLDEIIGNASVFYEYDDTILSVRIEGRGKNSSQGGIRDGKILKTIELNTILGNVVISQIESENGESYLAEFQNNNCYYAIYGVLPEKEFLKMIKKIWIN